MVTETTRIILVDDHRMVREAWKMLLHMCDGIAVIGECSSGTEAIEMVPRLKPDIVLMDINMSPVNGFEATRKILKICPEVKIIGVSINSQPVYAKNIMQLGAKGYVTKNSPKDEMIKAIHEVKKGNSYVCIEVRKNMKEGK